jgi:hypothetical protein
LHSFPHLAKYCTFEVHLPKKKYSYRTVYIFTGHVLEEETMSSGASTASDTELVETMATINLMELKGMAITIPKNKVILVLKIDLM